MPFTTNLIGSSVYMDCRGELYGKASLDECGICDGKGPQYFCEKTEKKYCTEAKYQMECNL